MTRFSWLYMDAPIIQVVAGPDTIWLDYISVVPLKCSADIQIEPPISGHHIINKGH